jgi:hypothetical protein
MLGAKAEELASLYFRTPGKKRNLHLSGRLRQRVFVALGW